MSEPPPHNKTSAHPLPADHAPKPTAYPPQNVPRPTEHVYTPQLQQPPQQVQHAFLLNKCSYMFNIHRELLQW